MIRSSASLFEAFCYRSKSNLVALSHQPSGEPGMDTTRRVPGRAYRRNRFTRKALLGLRPSSHRQSSESRLRRAGHGLPGECPYSCVQCCWCGVRSHLPWAVPTICRWSADSDIRHSVRNEGRQVLGDQYGQLEVRHCDVQAGRRTA